MRHARVQPAELFTVWIKIFRLIGLNLRLSLGLYCSGSGGVEFDCGGSGGDEGSEEGSCEHLGKCFFFSYNLAKRAAFYTPIYRSHFAITLHYVI